MMDPTEKRYPRKVLLAVSECPELTFHAWRRRNGILANEQCGRGQRYSAADIAVLRTIVVLVRCGVAPHAAARFIPHLVVLLVALFEGGDAGSVIALSRGPFASDDPGLSSLNPSDPGMRRRFIFDVTDPAELAHDLGVFIAIDLRGVVEHVRGKLEGIKP